MALRKNLKRHQFSAKLVTENRIPCAFCRRDVDDELVYGKLYAIGDIQCHYFCVLLSSCLVQKGKDDEGLFGFMYQDILAEIERSKKHKCSYCHREGATLGCAVSQCRKQFHLPCGRERNAVSLFYGNYKSFCQLHAHKQNIPDVIMQKVKLRRKESNKKIKCITDGKDDTVQNVPETQKLEPECVCVICYEEVDAYPSLQTFWPPCCARDAWFHRTCLQRMALSAGMHYLKCPLCNDKENFYEAVISQGYYVPDRDAAWELEQNAFAEIYERVLRCTAEKCLCPMGTNYDAEEGSWDIISCLLCGGAGWHRACAGDHSIGPAPAVTNGDHGAPGDHGDHGTDTTAAVCSACKPAATEDLHALAARIHAAAQRERRERRGTERPRRVMPSRMSLRRTKLSAAAHAHPHTTHADEIQRNMETSRQELGLKSPIKKLQNQPNLSSEVFVSPTKLIEQGFRAKIDSLGVKVKLDDNILDEVKHKLKKPKPLSAKRKAINDILDSILDSALKEPKQKDAPKEWCSPRKSKDNEERQHREQTPPQDVKQEPEIKEESENVPVKLDPIAESDDSSSTFQLPSEFIADHNSDDSLPIFNTPIKLKTVDIQKDSSLEISANDQSVNIDVVKMEEKDNVDFLQKLNIKSPIKSKKCAFKFSPLDKETLQENNVGIDLECFKNHYLNEVVREVPSECPVEIVNIEEKKITRKRKMVQQTSSKKTKCEKRRKLSKDPEKLKLKYKKMLDKRREQKKKLKTRVSIHNDRDNIQVKIKWKTEQLNVKITGTKKRKIKNKRTKLKQYVLQYTQNSVKDILVKPEKDVTPLKRKYVKQEKSPDKLVQTSIQSFFVVKTPKD